MDNENDMECCYQSLADICLRLSRHSAVKINIAILIVAIGTIWRLRAQCRCVPVNPGPVITEALRKPTRNARYLLIILLAVGTCPIAVADLQQRYSRLPSITAELKRYYLQNPQIYERSWVQFSPNGMRVRDATGSQEFMQSFVLDGAWLMDRTRMVYVSLNVIEDISDANSAISTHPQVGVLSAEPCIGSVAHAMGSASWRGQVINVWQCDSIDGTYHSTQFFSKRWGIVVREERHRQLVEELVDIQSKTFVQDYFIPDKKYRATDLRDLVIGHAKIRRYSE